MREAAAHINTEPYTSFLILSLLPNLGFYISPSSLFSTRANFQKSSVDMADEAVYAAGGDSIKRKYEESPPPAGRRSTGFSSPPDSGAPPPSYNNVPPPMNEIELAKQKAQEIAARLLSNSDPSKRARVENGAGAGGYDAIDTGAGQKHHPGLGLGGPPQSASYGGGYPGPNKKIDIPNGRVGVIIGKGGETIKYLQLQSGAKIQVTRDMDADPNSTSRAVELMGTPEQIAKAEQLINDVLSEADAGGSGRRVTGPPAGADQFVMKIPNNKVGLVIGKGGETIKNMQATTGARIQVIPLHLPPGDMSKERTVQIDGTSEQIEAAKQLVEEVTSENRPRGQSSMSGGYPQQGYQARPPTNWGPPGQQSGYGYVQPGSYPGPPQYSTNQPSYPGYPPQPTSGGYGPGWDQSAAPQNPQAASQGGGYDYYGQQQAAPAASQQQQAPSGDGSGYGYSQASAYSGYTPDGYGGYVYGQQPQSGGYDQHQQQGYSSAYPSQAGDPTQAPAPAPAAGGQPSPNPNYQAGYGTQPPSSQGGYGAQPPYGNYTAAPPQAQKPGSQPPPQQSPSAQGGYAVPRSQPPTSGYPATQPGGYVAPPQPYGAAAAQGGYGQPQYGGAYDAAPPQAAGAAKASPTT